MADSDDNIDSNFKSLKDYESTHEGIAWESLQSYLPNAQRNINPLQRGMILFCSLSLLLLMPQDSLRQGAIKHSAPAKIKSHSIDNRLTGENEQQGTGNPNGSIIENKKASMATTQITTLYPAHKSLIENTNQLQVLPFEFKQNDSISLVAVIPDSMIMNGLQFTEYHKNSTSTQRRPRLGYSLSAFYFFGIVDTYKYNNTFISNYKSYPGLGLKADLHLLLGNWFKRPISAKLGYKLMYKRFNFESINFFPEFVSTSNYKQTEFLHTLGVGVEVDSKSQNSMLEILLYQSLNDSKLLGATSVDLTLNKRMNFLKQGSLWLGIGVSVPISTRNSELKYYPISISLMNKF